ncbi:MAG: hypothetical protein K2H40_09625, partial [Lachnospiraceae bacterium]|nr:hypothetical protein [Lachnospiraceae bacterium]
YFPVQYFPTVLQQNRPREILQYKGGPTREPIEVLAISHAGGMAPELLLTLLYRDFNKTST